MLKAEMQKQVMNQKELDALFMDAVRRGRVDLADQYLSQGASLEAREAHTGRTAIHVAALYGGLQMYTMIRDRGADLGAKDKRQNNLVNLVAQSGQNEMLRTVLKDYKNPREVINESDAYGKNAMMWCAQGGKTYEPLMKTLNAHGADRGATDVDDWDAMAWAASRGETDSCKLLIEMGTMPSPKALQVAKEFNQLQTANFLEFQLKNYRAVMSLNASIKNLSSERNDQVDRQR